MKLLGTSADAIDRAEDRERFGELLTKLGLRAPAWGIAHGLDEAREIAERIGYPVLVRPSLRARRARDGDRPRPVGPGAVRADRDGGVAPREPGVARTARRTRPS